MTTTTAPAAGTRLDPALTDRRILFVGGGNMAAAMISGLVGAGVPGGRIAVIEPGDAPRQALIDRFGVTAWPAAEQLPADLASDVVVLAVKPQQAAQALPAIRPLLARNPAAVLVSIAAGTTLATLGALSGGHRCILRAMPNTPALVGAGIAGLYAPAGTAAADLAMAKAVLASTGAVVDVPSEASIDTVTAISGSGPAYAFYLMEAMIATGVQQGLAPAVARALALETVRGAALLALASDEPPAVLRQRVTSPGGTTAAAVAVLDQQRVNDALRDAMLAAEQRSRELSKG